MTPLIVGCPSRGGLATLLALSNVVAGEVTLAWSDREELVLAVPQVLEAGGTTLLVDATDEAATEHALVHQLQVMGAPQFVCMVAEDPRDAAELGIIAETLLRTVPPCAVLVIGGELASSAVTKVLEDLELPVPLSVSLEEAAEVAVELAEFARWETSQ